MGMLASIIVAAAIGGGIALKGQHDAKKSADKQEKAQKAIAEEQKAKTAAIQKAPEVAAEKAAEEAKAKRKRVTKTILTGPKGVTEEDTLGKKTLLGA